MQRSESSVQRRNNTIVERPEYVSASSEWDRLRHILVMLWPGLTLAALMKVMEEDYGFRATKDQYKKKFNEWYKKGMLPPKKRKTDDRTLKDGERVDGLEDGNTAGGKAVQNEHRLPTAVSTPGHDDPRLVRLSPLKPATRWKDEHNQLRTATGPPFSLGTARQKVFQSLLSDLWDAYFDAELGETEQVTIGEAVRNMVEFLVEVTCTDPELTTAITHAGDKALLYRVGCYLRPHCSHNEALLEQLEWAINRPQEQLSIPEEWPYNNSSRPTLDDLLRGPGEPPPPRYGSGVLRFCVSS
ncbi:hypothetical protein SLS60_002177 [Paraconiothyrium brasiliense]|uniref:Clr5 domain-containing protein n=1 Tax=Paraconiothyrium brasiliense TaxID=300254 RepID=A0ABR3S1E0_9PLEO